MTLADLSVLISASGFSAGKSILSEIETDKKRPSLALACRLVEITGIPLGDFVRPLKEKRRG